MPVDKQVSGAFPYSAAADALGLGGEGDALQQQLSEEEKARRKKLAQLSGEDQTQGARGMGLAATNLLGQFRA